MQRPVEYATVVSVERQLGAWVTPWVAEAVAARWRALGFRGVAVVSKPTQPARAKA